MRWAIKTALGAAVVINAHHLAVALIRLLTRTREDCVEAWECGFDE